jgi:hypothetical protein
LTWRCLQPGHSVAGDSTEIWPYTTIIFDHLVGTSRLTESLGGSVASFKNCSPCKPLRGLTRSAAKHAVGEEVGDGPRTLVQALRG